jgi:hypothetical protein
MTYYLCMSFFCCTFAPAKVSAGADSVKKRQHKLKRLTRFVLAIWNLANSITTKNGSIKMQCICMFKITKYYTMYSIR